KTSAEMLLDDLVVFIDPLSSVVVPSNVIPELQSKPSIPFHLSVVVDPLFDNPENSTISKSLIDLSFSSHVIDKLQPYCKETISQLG
ncbi:unnamed protein product, partial [Didymodactylos carnosus]